MGALYVGEIAVACSIDLAKDTYYSHRVRILSGHASGKDAYLAYGGNPESLNGNLVIRLDTPNIRKSHLSLEGEVLTGNFVTSRAPSGFDFAASDQAILYGIWEQRMRSSSEYPALKDIVEHFSIGFIFSVLHYALQGEWPAPYYLLKNSSYVLSHQQSNRTQGIASALQTYLGRINNRGQGDTLPRIITQ